ncbi:MAG: Fe-S cluster assembly protein SufD [Acidobacteriota bacterium]|nr:Fe-S cluster assembly protein SufD [Acidobacteriota bacterium]
MTTLAPADAYADAFEAVRRTAAAPDGVADLRRRAFERFTALGVPTTRLEAWRFTNVAPIASTAFALAAPAEREAARADTAPHALSLGAGLLFVNGRHVAPASDVSALPAGVEVLSLADVLALDANETRAAVEAHLASGAGIENEAFTALNTALLHDGAVERVPANTVVEQPIQLLFVTSPPPAGEPVMTHPRVLLVVGENAQVRVVESYGGGDSPYLTNTVTEVIAGPSAVVDHYKLVREGPSGYHIGATHVRLGRAANFSSHAVTLGGAIVRNDAQALLDGEGVECTLNGLYLANGSRLVDNHTTIHHAQPHCSSHELYKGILDGEARAVFNGKIIVAIDAQKTDAKQTNKALLLSEDAQINTKPELEIFADDVKCTHGATVGQLDEDALFYLRARGLGLEQARSVLIHAFASDLLNHIAIEPIRDRLDDLLLAQLPGSGGGSFHVG